MCVDSGLGFRRWSLRPHEYWACTQGLEATCVALWAVFIENKTCSAHMHKCAPHTSFECFCLWNPEHSFFTLEDQLVWVQHLATEESLSSLCRKHFGWMDWNLHLCLTWNQVFLVPCSSLPTPPHTHTHFYIHSLTEASCLFYFGVT